MQEHGIETPPEWLKENLFDLLRWLEREADRRAAPEPGVAAIGHSDLPEDESLRIAQAVTTGHVADDVEDVRWVDDERRKDVRWVDDERRREGHWLVRQYAFGLFGTNGIMPPHWTEAILGDEPALGALGDLFHHRFAGYFYRAWSDIHEFDGPRDQRKVLGPARRLRALIGQLPVPKGEGVLFEGALGFVGRLNGPGTVDALCVAAAAVSGMKAEVREYTGAWLEIPERAYTRLLANEECASLGRGSYLGRRRIEGQQCITLVLTPRSWQQAAAFIPRPAGDRRGTRPSGTEAQALADVLDTLAGAGMDWVVRIRLAHGDVPRTTLGGSAWLGMGAWLHGPVRHRDELKLKRRHFRAGNTKTREIA